MVSWSSGKLEEASNRSNNAKPSALKQDFLARLDGAQPVYRTLQQPQDLGQASGQLPSFLQQCSGPHLWPEPTGRAGMMCFWVSRTLNAQHDAGWHHRGFLVLLPCSCAAPPLQLPSARVVCHQAVRWVTLPEGCLEPAGRVCSLQPAGGMQHNLLDLPEWPQVNLHRGKAAHISPVRFKRGPHLHLLWSALAVSQAEISKEKQGWLQADPSEHSPSLCRTKSFPKTSRGGLTHLSDSRGRGR